MAVMMAQFTPSVVELGWVAADGTADQISQEPMVFAASWDFISEVGGPLTQEALSVLEENLKRSEYPEVIFDSRVQLLQKGEYSAIPGYHCDFYRRIDGQPDLTYDAQGWIASFSLVSNGWAGAETEVIAEPVDITWWDRKHVWKSVHDQVKDKSSLLLNHGCWNWISQKTIHRATPAKESTWRFWLRVAHTDNTKCVNKIRRQTMVYVVDESSGW